MTTRAVKAVIRGRVQGVSYRAWTQATARAHDLRGWVRNETDGSVHAVFAGEREAIEAMRQALWQGPPAARVEDVVVSEAPVPDSDGFEITD